jgi:hypothetical protein
MSLGMCLALLVTQSNGKHNLDKHSRLLQVPRKIAEQLGTFSSDLGASFFPSAVYIFAGSVLESGRSNQEQGNERITWDGSLDELCPKFQGIWNRAGLSTADTQPHLLPAKSLNSVGTDIKGCRKSTLTDDASFVAHPDVASKRNSYSFNNNGGAASLPGDSTMVDQTSQQRQLPNIDFNKMDSMMSASPRNWGVSPISNATLAPPSDSMSIQGNIEGDSPWFTKDSSTYSAAADLFHFAQSNQANQMPMLGQLDTHQMESIQNTLSTPDSMPGVIGGMAMDPALPNIGGADDLFFELSSLDH